MAIGAEVSRAVSFLHDHMGEEVGLDAVCSAAGLSRSSLSERFRAAMGVSPMRYLRRIRLARAAELLTTTAQGVARVARTVGYSSTSSFSRAFRDAYGASPGTYRRTGGTRAG